MGNGLDDGSNETSPESNSIYQTIIEHPSIIHIFQIGIRFFKLAETHAHVTLKFKGGYGLGKIRQTIIHIHHLRLSTSSNLSSIRKKLNSMHPSTTYS